MGKRDRNFLRSGALKATLKARFTTPNHCLVPNQQTAGFCLFFMLVSILQNGILKTVPLSTVLSLLLQKKDLVSRNVNK